jgi:four helix bundle protein
LLSCADKPWCNDPVASSTITASTRSMSRGMPLRLGDAIARRLPRGYTNLSDQLRRALLAAYLGIAEASGRQGQDRLARFRCARGEAAEAAAAVEVVQILALAPAHETQAVLDPSTDTSPSTDPDTDPSTATGSRALRRNR